MFMSKKQKKLMRERKRKKKLSGSKRRLESGKKDDEALHHAQEITDEHDDDEKHRNHNGSNGITLAGSESMTKTETQANSASATAEKRIFVVPKYMSSKEAKKFRKEKRREARKEGIVNDELIVFVEEGKEPPKDNKAQDETQPESSSRSPHNHNKKRKRSFPQINQLLAEEKQKEEKKAKKEAQEKSESQLTNDVKDCYRAVDCEMVGVGKDGKISALARVSMTDWSGNVLLDTFVKVPGKVTDFRTQWSGVTARHIKSDSAMDVEACRAQVAALLKGKILVGHALKNDLDALMLSHPKHEIRDTARYRPYQRLAGRKWRPRKLRDLVKQHCDMEIQREGESHDSIDDARAAMELFKVSREAWEAEMDRKAKKR